MTEHTVVQTILAIIHLSLASRTPFKTNDAWANSYIICLSKIILSVQSIILPLYYLARLNQVDDSCQKPAM